MMTTRLAVLLVVLTATAFTTTAVEEFFDETSVVDLNGASLSAMRKGGASGKQQLGEGVGFDDWTAATGWTETKTSAISWEEKLAMKSLKAREELGESGATDTLPVLTNWKEITSQDDYICSITKSSWNNKMDNDSKDHKFLVADIEECQEHARNKYWRYISYNPSPMEGTDGDDNELAVTANCYISPLCNDEDKGSTMTRRRSSSKSHRRRRNKTLSFKFDSDQWTSGWKIWKFTSVNADDVKIPDCHSKPSYMDNRLWERSLRWCKSQAKDADDNELTYGAGMPICTECWKECGHFLEKVHNLGGRCWGGERSFARYTHTDIRATDETRRRSNFQGSVQHPKYCVANCYRTGPTATADNPGSSHDWYNISSPAESLRTAGRLNIGKTRHFACTRHCNPYMPISMTGTLAPTGPVSYLDDGETTASLVCDFHKTTACEALYPTEHPSNSTNLKCFNEKMLSCSRICKKHRAGDHSSCNATACDDYPNICNSMAAYM